MLRHLNELQDQQQTLMQRHLVGEVIEVRVSSAWAYPY